MLDVLSETSTASRTYGNRASVPDWSMVAICLLFSGALAVWFFFDHSWPYWDAASHVKDAFRYAELFRHPKFWSPAWIHSFLTVNYAYPLTVHAFNGLIKAVFGSGKWVDGLSLVCFSLILNVSVYRLAYMFFQDRLRAVISVAIINCYPLTSSLSHFPMLDFPYLALYCLGMLAVATWQQQPSWRRTLALGLGVGLAITSKQIGVLYFAFPCLVLFIATIFKARVKPAIQLAMAGTMALSFLLSWVIPNGQRLRMVPSDVGAEVGITSFCQSFITHLSGYLSALPQSMSPLLFMVFIAALWFTGRAQLVNSRLPILSALSGMLLVSCIQFSDPEQRYIVPVLLSAALITANFLAKLLRSKFKILKATLLGILLAALFQFVLLNYTPYPLSVPPSVVRLSRQLHGPESPSKKLLLSLSKPTPKGDVWGQEWIVDTVAKFEHGQPCWLAVMPSTAQISVNTLDIISHYKNAQVLPTTFRKFTLYGDEVSYSETTIGYFQWFLLKTGHQGNNLKDKQSEKAYRKIVDYVQNSKKFTLKAQRLIADSNVLSLYRSSDLTFNR